MPPLLRNLKPGQKAEVFTGQNKGMAPDLKPSKLSPGQPFLAINSRFQGGDYVLRGGQRRLLKLNGKITGLGTHKIGASAIGGGPSLYIGNAVFNPNFKVGNLPPWRWPNDGVGHWLNAFDGELLCVGNSSLVVSGYGVIGKLVGVSVAADISGPDYGPEPEPYLGVSPTIATGGAGFTNDAVCALDHLGDLIIGQICHDNANPLKSAIWKFDTLTLTMDLDLSAIGDPSTLEEFNSTAVLTFAGGGPNGVRVRAANGTWGALIPPSAGVLTGPGRHRCQQFRNKLYIPDGNPATGDAFVLTTAGVLTRLPRATTGIDAGGFIQAFARLRRYLYYIWMGAGSVGAFLGRYDGTTWTPKYKILSAQASYPAYLNSNGSGYVPTAHVPGRPAGDINLQGLREYKGCLVTSATEGGNPYAMLYISPKNDITGTWQLAFVGHSNADAVVF